MPKGRPRTFDIDAAIDAAMLVFWEKGYAGASLDDLTIAMGISRPSLYAAFENKEGLFMRVLDRYADGPADYLPRSLHQPTAEKVVAEIFHGMIELLRGPGRSGTCLVIRGSMEAGREFEHLRKNQVTRLQQRERKLKKRFDRAIREGDLSAGVDTAGLASFVTAIVYGLTVQAAGGATRKQLQRVVDIALSTLPK